jgi:hypothetical protein
MRTLINNMSKGALAPELRGRVDITQYASAVASVQNWFIHKAGGMKTRPGSLVIGELDSLTDNARLIPFDYGLDFSYVVGAQNGLARVISAGGFVVEEDLQITALTKGETTGLEIAYHDMLVGDRIFLDGIVGTVELNRRVVEVLTVLDAGNITVDVDSTGFADFVSSSGAVRVVSPTPTPAPAPTPSPPPAPTPPPVITTPNPPPGTDWP